MVSPTLPRQHEDSDTASEHADAATHLRPVVAALLGEGVPIRFEFWDGSAIDHPGPAATLRFRSPDAVRRIVWMPNELGLARAYVAGELQLDGDMFAAVETLRNALQERPPAVTRALPTAIAAARKVGALGGPLPPPPEEARIGGWRRHSMRRDSEAVRHHYDVGNEFYRLVLGPAMTYSCARFTEPGLSLEDAQAAKHELICRKLGLPERPGARLLDVGCGWGSMAIHAAVHHQARVVGVTLSEPQAALARERAKEAGVNHLVDIRVQDYRDLRGETFDAISSIGMSEHVGHAKIDTYFETLRAALVPEGRLLNHAISRVGGSKMSGHSFIGRYVFPDGELIDLGGTILSMEKAGFEVRDVESLREHYALTLREWVANLRANWDEAVRLVGEARARVWYLYMAGSAISFEKGRINVHQVLGVVPSESGASGMPPTRRGWD